MLYIRITSILFARKLALNIFLNNLLYAIGVKDISQAYERMLSVDVLDISETGQQVLSMYTYIRVC